MRILRRPSLVLLTLCLLPACAADSGSGVSGTPSVAGAVENDDQRTLYVLGQLLGRNIANAGLTEEEIGAVLLGVQDSALGREPQVDVDTYMPQLQAFMEGRVSAAAEAELTASTAFVQDQAALAGAVRTDSGIVIQELEAGSEEHPTPQDTVEVHYHGTLRDGTVFDSSVERGEPATFPLNGVIPCWTEGLQTMGVGGRSRLVCPPDMAYGAQSPPGIPGNAALVFEVELLRIVR